MIARCLITFAIVLAPATAHGEKPLVELTVGTTPHSGRSLAHDDQTCWLQADDGQLTEISLQQVTSYRKVSPTFRSLSVMEMRERVSRDVGRRLEVAAHGRFVVAGPAGRAAGYAKLLDQVHRSYTSFFSRRNFNLATAEFPLVAVIYPDEAGFVEHCTRERVRYAPGLRGYYNPKTNRVTLFEFNDDLVLRKRPPGDGVRGPVAEVSLGLDDLVLTRHPTPRLALMERPGSIEANLRDTIVHEATHQLAFNTGLHTRIGENPRWVVEGLAMVFEREGRGASSNHGSESSRLNAERFNWFMRNARPDPTPVSDFVASDRDFGSATLNAYSQAWALAFYLTERRSADFATYLQTICARGTQPSYSSEERVADFQKCFGGDIAWLQVEWLRFMDGIR